MTGILRIKTGVRLSRAVVHNQTIYLAGVTSDDITVDVKAQTEQVLRKIDQVLEEAGSDKSRILYAQIWLKDIKNGFALMNTAWENWVVPGKAPARATVEATLAAEDILVEIAVTAAAYPVR